MRERVIHICLILIVVSIFEPCLGPFGLVHRLSDLGGILLHIRVGEGAVTEFIDRVLLFLALALQPSIV